MNPTDPPADVAASQPRPPAARVGEFEFSEQQNVVFRELAGAMKFVGTVLIVIGVLSAVGGVVSLSGRGSVAAALGTLVEAVIYSLIGVWIRNAAGAVAQIAATTGNDIANLMVAMGELKRVFFLQKVLFLIVIALIVLAIVVGLLGL